MALSCGLPRIDNGNAELLEILHVAGYDAEIMFKSCRGDHAVGNVQWPSGKLPFSIEHSPSLRDHSCYGQDAVPEPGRNAFMNRALKLRSSFDHRKGKK